MSFKFQNELPEATSEIKQLKMIFLFFYSVVVIDLFLCFLVSSRRATESQALAALKSDFEGDTYWHMVRDGLI